MPRVVVHRGASCLDEYNLAGTRILVAGRHRTNDIVLPDDSRNISRYHAAFVPIQSESRYFVRDLGSLHTTRVGGLAVDRHLLRNGDVIEIGDYKLVFSDGTGTAGGKVDLMSVVGRRTADAADVPTKIVRRPEAVRPTVLTADRTELLDHLSRQSAGGTDLRTLLESAAALVVAVVRADRGFIRLFDDGHERSHQDLGATGFDDGSAIQITDSGFMESLLAGKCVRDGATLLAPILSQDRLVGMFCLDRHRTSKLFTDEDGEFLVAAGRRATAVAGGVEASARPSAGEPIAWETQIIGRSRRMREFMVEIGEAAKGDRSVLISGESGSGKELAAAAIQQRALRYANGPFIRRDCSSLPEEAAVTELFGYAPKVPLAGANPEGAPGWFEMAIGGALFLDEIQNLTLPMQRKFLRVLQEKEVCRYGARLPIPVDVKVIAATSIVDLEAAVERGAFETALYHRFRVVRLPPLRERLEDIPLLAFYLLDRHAAALGARTRSISRRALEMLSSYSWPGNVRELDGMIQKAVASDREVLFSWDLDLPANGARAAPATGPDGGGPTTMREAERETIKEVLQATLGNKTRAAKILDIARMTLLNKMDQLGIPRNYGEPGQSTQ